MARIRTIKPEFPQSETIGKLSRDARLLFVQLWTIADDAGRLRGASRMLASLLYPYDDDAPKLMPDWLDELERHECIRRYQIDGAQYVEIVNWLKHQKIDRPSESRLPAYREDAAIPREDSRASDADLGPRTSTGKGPISRAVAKATRPDPEFEEFKKAYPRRKGANPWQPARKLFDAAKTSGVEASRIIAALRAGVGFDREKVGTEFIPQAVKWLRDRRWEDHQPQSIASPEALATPNDLAVKFFKQLGRWHPEYGPEPGKLGCRAAEDILSKYGYSVAHETEAA